MRRLLSILILVASAATAQPAVSGRVLDAQTGAPLPGVHVYLSGTATGDITDRDGAYAIATLPAGEHELVATFVGYRSGVRRVRGGAAQAVDFRLRPRAEVLGGVAVEADRSAWLRQLAAFEAAFVGGSEDARAVRLLNPEVLSFEAAPDGFLRARSEAPLLVENQALGYRLAYDLVALELLGDAVAFHGYARFEPLGARDDGERTRWAAARRRAYAGSFAHFVPALAADQLAENGFRVYRANTRHRLPPSRSTGEFRLDRVERAADVLRPLGDGVAALTADPALYLRVDYTGEDEERAYRQTENRAFDARTVRRRSGDQISWVETPDGRARVDLRTGGLAGAGRGVSPLVVSGYWWWDERAAHWLPSDYRPAGDL